MLPASVRHKADDEFTSFVDELARNADLEGLLFRLRHGHHPDDQGWCDHPCSPTAATTCAANRCARAAAGWRDSDTAGVLVAALL
jgi:hypothetical protein